ncbi:LLM class flavin-dependent oxidoreductase [Mycobacterium kyogaense]|uniref:LLM class flavin-dependent oxidoreductase n=1 Tax=Mycobacterium kyogaense TaxID=2212479 RepID=UPI000DADA779|nr:LLM class flavin-dependent oxidoreductase [Mycobacterium kyogaense]
MAPPPRRPFAAGSVSLGLHPDTELSARGQIDLLLQQAVVAEIAGFDGVTLSEHHNGFPGYLPQPLLVTNWLLAATSTVWSGPAPTILSVRNGRLFAEELAWTATKFPGRVTAALAPGYARADFDYLNVPYGERAQRFERQLRALTQTLHTSGDCSDGDAAARGWPASGAPVLVAANSAGGVARAARFGLGVMFPGGEDPVRLARLSQQYRALGGPGPVVWTRTVWLGELPADVSARFRRRYQDAADTTMRQHSGFRIGIACGDARDIAAELAEEHHTIGADAIDVRLHLPGVPSEDITAMIDSVGTQMVSLLRALM